MSRFIAVVLVFHLCVLAAIAATAFAQPPEKAEKSESSAKSKTKPFRRYDNFDDKLSLKWKPVRADKEHWSLKKHGGQLTITTQRGTIHRDEKTTTSAEAGKRRTCSLWRARLWDNEISS